MTKDLSNIFISTWAIHVGEETVEGWFSDFAKKCQKGLKVPDRSFSINICCLWQIFSQKLPLFGNLVNETLKPWYLNYYYLSIIVWSHIQIILSPHPPLFIYVFVAWMHRYSYIYVCLRGKNFSVLKNSIVWNRTKIYAGLNQNYLIHL